MEGNFGDHKQLSTQLYELRFVVGGGLRIYYTIRGKKIILLLTGGNKSSQSKDIATAKDMLNELEWTMTLKTRSFDVAEILKTDEDIQGFLNEAAGNADEFIHALNTAARAGCSYDIM